MPVRRVGVVEITERGDVPADGVVFLHGHHGRVAVDVSVDGPLDVGAAEAGFGDGAGNSGGGENAEFGLLDSLGIGGVIANVVVEIPAFVFVDRDIHGNEFTVDVFGRAVWTGHAAARDHEAAEQSGGNVAQLIAVGVV